MSGYETRLAIVANVLAENKIILPGTMTQTDLAALVLHALDHISENVRR